MKEKNQRKCIHCEHRGHIMDNSISKQHGNPPMAADASENVSTNLSLTLTLNTLIENDWIVA